MPPRFFEGDLDIPAPDKRRDDHGQGLVQVGGEDRHRLGLATGIDDQHPANRHRPLAGGIP